MRTLLIDVYIDFVNNYLTVELFAEHALLTVPQAETLLTLAKDVYHTDIEDVL